jgi:hypothetical protein
LLLRVFAETPHFESSARGSANQSAFERLSRYSYLLRSLFREAAMRVLLVLVLLGVTPAGAAAQAVPVTLPTNDAIVAIGWAGAEHTVYGAGDWHGSVFAGGRAGHYWTDHLKTEINASWSGSGTRQIYETIERQGGYTYAISDYRATDIRVGVAQLYQFGRNAWAHPYVGVGADVVHRSATTERDAQSRSVFVGSKNIPVDIPAASERTTSVFVQAILKAGAKMYVSDAMFFNTELTAGVAHGLDHLVWTIGIGVDF